MSLQKLLWICAGIGTLLAGYLHGAPALLLIALLFVVAIPTVLLVASSTCLLYTSDAADDSVVV